MLLHDIGKAVTRTTDEKGVDHFYGHAVKSTEMAETILRRLKFDNKSMDKILKLIKYHDREIVPQPSAVSRAVNVIGENVFTDLLKVKRADRSAQNPEDMEKGLESVDLIERAYLELLEKNNCMKLSDLAIDGRDLIMAGFMEGPEIGRTLSVLFDRVLEDPALNDKEILMGMVSEILKQKFE